MGFPRNLYMIANEVNEKRSMDEWSKYAEEIKDTTSIETNFSNLSPRPSIGIRSENDALLVVERCFTMASEHEQKYLELIARIEK